MSFSYPLGVPGGGAVGLATAGGGAMVMVGALAVDGALDAFLASTAALTDPPAAASVAVAAAAAAATGFAAFVVAVVVTDTVDVAVANAVVADDAPDLTVAVAAAVKCLNFLSSSLVIRRTMSLIESSSTVFLAGLLSTNFALYW